MPPDQISEQPVDESTPVMIPSGYSHERIQVKFKEGTVIRLRNGGLVTLANDDLSGLQAVLNSYPGISIERLFTRPEADLDQERARQQVATGRPQPDLNLWYRLVLPSGTNAEALLADLNVLPMVETAYAEPLPAAPPGNLGPPPAPLPPISPSP